MKYITKCTAVCLLLSALLSLLCGCISVKTGREGENEGLYIVCTAYPQYDFIKNIAGDAINLEMLVPDGTDTHNFGLKDISVPRLARLEQADLILYVGGESDEKLISDLKKALPESVRFVSLLSLVNDPLTTSEGHSHDDGHDHANELDEHVWTSPMRAIELVEGLCTVLGELDTENAKAYREGAETYKEELTTLDLQYEELIEQRSFDMLIFADRYPFRYLCHDYGILAEAAFSGCSSEVEPSLAVLDALYEKAKVLGLPAILYMEGSNSQYAENIAKKCSAEAMMLHSCHILTSEEMKSKNYITLMEENLAVLKTALGAK